MDKAKGNNWKRADFRRRNIERVEMGLDGDWRENSMTVWEDGKFMMYDCFNGSKWAEPIIIVYYKDAPSEVYSVWRKGM